MAIKTFGKTISGSGLAVDGERLLLQHPQTMAECMGHVVPYQMPHDDGGFLILAEYGTPDCNPGCGDPAPTAKTTCGGGCGCTSKASCTCKKKPDPMVGSLLRFEIVGYSGFDTDGVTALITERGAEGTIKQDWPAGTLVSQAPTGSELGALDDRLKSLEGLGYEILKVHNIAGVIRQNPVDRTKWEFLDDEAHTPLGFDSATSIPNSDGVNLAPRAASETLLIFFKKATDARRIDANDTANAFYDKVLSVVVAPDEVLANKYGITLGARVTRSGLQIKGSMRKTISGRIWYSEDSWKVTADTHHSPWYNGGVVINDPADPTFPLSYDPITGILTVDHAWIPSNALTLIPDARTGFANEVYVPAHNDTLTESFQVRFIQGTDSNNDGQSEYYVGEPNGAMSFRFSKTFQGALKFDGTDGFDNIEWTTGDAGNIWIHGVMLDS